MFIAFLFVPGCNPLNKEEIEYILNASEIEQQDSSEGGDDIADNDFNLNREITSSSSSSDNESGQSVTPITQTRARGQGQKRGTRSRARRFRGIRVGREFLEGDDGWEECEFQSPDVFLSQPSYLPIDRSSFSEVDYFRQYIDDSVIENIVEKSNWSYFARYTKSLNLTFEECNTYIAISMIMSCINYPSLRMYWAKEFRIPIIANIMPRNRFLLLRTALKVVLDEDVGPDERQSDKLWKVRPLITAVLKSCKLQEKTQDLSVDEMMIPFQGTCGVKQYCPGKPNPVGLKAFVLATPQGLVCDFHIYQGSTTYPDFHGTDFGLAEKAVLSLTRDLIPGHIIYCDRYFTSQKLVLALQDKGLKCTGTVMKNRIPRSARSVLTDDKAMKKKPRGSWHIAVNKAKKLVLTKWLDSKAHNISVIHTDQNVDECQRWSKSQRKYISVPRPEVVKLYNRNMGGVDVADRMLSYCPYRYRTKKWTQRVISHFIDLAVSNSWILYRHDKKQEGVDLKSIKQLRFFKLDVAKRIIDANIDTGDENSLNEESQQENEEQLQDDSQVQRPRFRKRNAPVPLPSERERYRGALHLPEVSDIQKKCRFAGCQKKTKMMCTSCKIHLCLTNERNCYKIFHTP